MEQDVIANTKILYWAAYPVSQKYTSNIDTGNYNEVWNQTNPHKYEQSF